MTTTSPPAPARPAHVELLIGYANSIDHELATDDLTTPAELDAWVTQHGLLREPGSATEQDLVLARRLREALQSAFTANHEGTGDFTALDAVAEQLPLRLGGRDVPGDSPQPGLVPVLDGVPGALTRLLVAVNASVVDGTWRRLKLCAADDCGWAFFDASKNRSRTWCEWGCGNKAKTRSYRERHRAAAQGSA